jgi:hypothetical protein
MVIDQRQQLNQLLNFLNGRDDQPDDIGAVAQFVTSHLVGHPRPQKDAEDATRFVYRWPDVASLRTHARWYGPDITPSQIDAAIAAAGL